MRPDDPLLLAARRHLVEIAPGSARPGDVLLFRMAPGAPAKHCAILTEPFPTAADGKGRSGQIVHAYWGRAVVETPLVPWWSRRIVAAFSFPGVTD
jgi:NlpC/P60 family putative phage cell wall peptidase